MQSVKGQIERRLTASLNPEVLEVIDFSAEHQGHASAPDQGQSHFHVKIKADILTNKRRVDQHRIIQRPLKELMPLPIHALRIEILA